MLGGTRKAGPGAAGVKNSPGESPLISGRIRYGCGRKSSIAEQQKTNTFGCSFQRVKKASSRLPWRGKRSAVAVVNDNPVDCQSRDRAARRRLSAKLTEGWKVRC